jgi:hypothetical protein
MVRSIRRAGVKAKLAGSGAGYGLSLSGHTRIIERILMVEG